PPLRRGHRFLPPLRFRLYLPDVPVPGDGKARLPAVPGQHLRPALGAALQRGRISGVHELGGPEAVTYDEMLEETMRGTGIRRPRGHLPVLLVKPAAFAMTVMPDPPVTIDQLDLLAVDNTPKNNALEPVFGVRPRPFKGALDYLRRR